MIRHPFGETVIIHPYLEEAGLDDYNVPIPGWGEDIPVENVAVAPRVEPEDRPDLRNPIVSGYRLYADYDVPVGPHDEITVRGVRYQVDGEIARWQSPFTGARPGAVITVKAVEG